MTGASDRPQHLDSPNAMPVLSRLLVISNLLSSLVGLGFFAYVIGWNFLSAYFDEFGAGWLITEVPQLLFLKYTQWIVYTLGPLMFFSTARLSVTHTSGLFSEKWRRRLLLYGPLVAGIVPGALKAALKYWAPEFLPKIPLWISAQLFSCLGISVVFLALFEEFIVQLRSKKDQLRINIRPARYQPIPLIFALVIVIWGVVSIPAQFGSYQARTDKNPLRSKLPFLTLHENRTRYSRDLRLLLLSNNRFYGVYLDGASYPVTILSPSDILVVQTSNKSIDR